MGSPGGDDRRLEGEAELGGAPAPSGQLVGASLAGASASLAAMAPGQTSLPLPPARTEAGVVSIGLSGLPMVFGRYLLLRRLSRGGMGEIFLAKLGEIQGFEKPVIIKKILPNLSADPEFVKRFIDEAQVAIKLNHANIAAVYEVGKVDGDYFLALEYVEGRDLRRLLTRCREEGFRTPPDLCLFIGRELASGLGYAHRRTDGSGRTLALVHCDISPPNVMVSFEGEVKVIDFGIAKSAIRIAGLNPNIGFGKFGYMAPEQLIRGGVVDRRTDIYAAGVVLYELLTGERLFQFPEGADYKEVARIVTRGEFVPPSKRSPGLDPSFDVIVCKALATRKEARYQTAEELRDAIQSKLSQMNPTISGDQLAHLVRELFADEIDEERALVVSTKEFDVSEFRDELTGSRHNTVTYARAGLMGRRSGLHSIAPARAAPARRRRPNLTMLMAFGGGTAIGILLLAVAIRYAIIASEDSMSGAASTTAEATSRAPAPRTATPPAPVALRPAVPSAPAPSPAVEPTSPESPSGAGAVTVTPIAVPRSDATSRRAKRANPTGSQRSTTAADPTREEPSQRLPVPPPSDRPNDEIVKSNFRMVQKEYESFRLQYGARLEADWNAIASEITFGKPGEKYLRVNKMLDALRRDMAKVRTGG